MEFFCLCLTVFGLIICFGGIYIKKFCSSIMGLIWGAIIVMILIVLSTESIWQVDSEESLAWIVIGAIAFAIIAAIEEKICAFLNSATPVFFLVSVFMIFNAMFDNGIEMTAIFFVALIFAIIAGWIACIFYVIAFMVETAFTGAFIACIGMYGLFESAYDLGELVFDALRDDEVVVGIFFGTIILGIIGFRVQWRRFIATKEEKVAKLEKTNWICQCGARNPNDYQFCESCGKKRIAATYTPISTNWTCECGNVNTLDAIFCVECGKKRIGIQQTQPTWLCSCGFTNKNDMAFCSDCGKPRVEPNQPETGIYSNSVIENEVASTFDANYKTTSEVKKNELS